MSSTPGPARSCFKGPIVRSRSCLASSLQHADGTEPGDFSCNTGAGHDIDDALDVLVSERRLLGELGVRRTADDDAPAFELFAQRGSVHLPFGGAAAHRSTGAVARAR